MARPCLCCNHPERAALDAALVGGTPLRDVSERFAITKTSILRHMRSHLPKAAIEAAKVEREEAEGRRGVTLLDQAHDLLVKARDLLDAAEESGDIQTALRGVREARECLAFIARLTGDVGPDVSIVVNAQLIGLQQIIVETLAPFPEARAAVAARLAHMAEQPP